MTYEPNHFNLWQRAFMEEWSRLAEGKVDIHQTADLAVELYRAHRDQDPVQVAREQFDAGE
jgi:hypothetical protein